MAYHLGFNELMYKIPKYVNQIDYLHYLCITETFDICQGCFLVPPWSLMDEFSNLLSGTFVR